MPSLNQIKKSLVQFFDGHAQINQVAYCDEKDFAAMRDITYPAANIEYLDSNINGNLMTHRFVFNLEDLADENIPGIEDEIYSDMLEVAEDFYSWLWEQLDYQFTKQATIEKYVDKGGDRVAGISFRINLTTVRRQNPCVIPTKA